MLMGKSVKLLALSLPLEEEDGRLGVRLLEGRISAFVSSSSSNIRARVSTRLI
jgi:hypothetical protein